MDPQGRRGAPHAQRRPRAQARARCARERAARRERIGNVKLERSTGRALRQARRRARARRQALRRARRSSATCRCASCAATASALIGPNGAGKTTLLKLILGELAPDSGHGAPRHAPRRRLLRPAARSARSRAHARRDDQPRLGLDRDRRQAASTCSRYLGDFLFPPQRANAPVKTLSGGERNRLLLARLFAQPANLLVLDEPTNDLDIESLELLEATLQAYTGTLLLVSHDRAFLDNVVDADAGGAKATALARVRRRLQRLARAAAAPALGGGGATAVARSRGVARAHAAASVRG